MRIAVVGAGVVGMATAWALARDGHRVSVFDRALEAGTGGASFGNGAQLSYTYVAPLADPSLLPALPWLLAARDSPMRWRPRGDAAHWRWLAAFMLACRRGVAEETTRHLLALAAESREALDLVVQETGLAFARRRIGKLVVLRSTAALQAAVAQQRRQREMGGAAQDVLDATACRAMEPALAPDASLAGGIWTPTEEVADAAQFCQALTQALEPTVAFRFGCGVRAILCASGAVSAVRTDAGDIAVDAVVVCAGASAADLLRPLGMNTPIEPLKGYSLTLPHGPRPLRVSVTDAAAKVVFAPLPCGLRVAGVADLVGRDTTIDERRLSLLRDAGRRLLPEAADWNAEGAPWAGLRPATPTGRPMIGPSRVPGLLLNIGHGGLGWTLAAGSALRLAAALRHGRGA